MFSLGKGALYDVLMEKLHQLQSKMAVLQQKLSIYAGGGIPSRFDNNCFPKFEFAKTPASLCCPASTKRKQ